jgi:acyl-CoA-binding protein
MIDKEKLKKLFEEKSEKLRTTNIKTDNNQKLKFYGLYKVATVGKYSEKNKLKAGFFDFSTKYKNEAWEKCSVFSQEEAMIEYLKFYSEITGEKLNLDFNISTSTKKTISDIAFDVPIGLESQGTYSSTAKETKQNLDNYLKTAPEDIKKFQTLKDKIYGGDFITENILKEFEMNNKMNLLQFRDDINQTLLHIAVDAINFSCVDTLIKVGYAQDLINEKDNIGMTPLHIGAINFDLHIYELLTSLNPNYNIKDNEGKTCKDYLKENEDAEIPKKYLRDE